MGRTYKRNSGFKRDRRDKNFNRSRKFKEWESKSNKSHKSQQPTDDVDVQEQIPYDGSY